MASAAQGEFFAPLPPKRKRFLNKRVIILLVVLVVALMGAAAYYGYAQEQQRLHRDKVEQIEQARLSYQQALLMSRQDADAVLRNVVGYDTETIDSKGVEAVNFTTLQEAQFVAGVYQREGDYQRVLQIYQHAEPLANNDQLFYSQFTDAAIMARNREFYDRMSNKYFELVRNQDASVPQDQREEEIVGMRETWQGLWESMNAADKEE